MKIYTRTGDMGRTDLADGERVAKDTVRVDAIGTLDELNSVLGMVRCEALPEGLDEVLRHLQEELFLAGGELASPRAEPRIGKKHVLYLETEIDRLGESLEPLEEFLLPAGCRATAELHLARTVCRRAERRGVALAHTDEESVSPDLLAYLNRLADLLFTLARAANRHAGREEVARESRP